MSFHAGLVFQLIPTLHHSPFPPAPLFPPSLTTHVHLTSWVPLHLPLLGPTLTPFLVFSEDHVIIQAEFYLKPEESGEYMFDFDGDEIFHVDMEKKETVWRLPEFGRFASFEAQGALANRAVNKANLDIMMKRSNYTPNTNGTSLCSSPPRLGNCSFKQMLELFIFVTETFPSGAYSCHRQTPHSHAASPRTS